VRIDAKRLRYGVDATASLFPTKRTTRYLRTLCALQDALGRSNDAANASRLLVELKPPGRFGDFARGWLAAVMHGDPPHLESLVERLREGRRFWRRKPSADAPKT
jgi:CHAD domain-containing protein